MQSCGGNWIVKSKASTHHWLQIETWLGDVDEWVWSLTTSSNYFCLLRFSDVNYSHVVFPGVKPVSILSNEDIKTLTRDNLQEIEERFQSQSSISRSPRMPHFSTTDTTDSDYLSTIPTETTDFMATYKVLEGTLNVFLRLHIIKCSLRWGQL